MNGTPVQGFDTFKSASQKARVFGENWIASNLPCPNCASDLDRTKNNTSAKDFSCSSCESAFELKSKRGMFGNRVVDGAYSKMLEAVQSGICPNLILLSYTPDYQVQEVTAIPGRFLVQEIVLPRAPLGPHCHRAGWQGCNLDIGMIPMDGRVSCVQDFHPIPIAQVRSAWRKTAFLDDISPASRGWLAITMALIRKMAKERFTLADLYSLESEAARVFPGNSHIRAKLRQQLQLLRDAGWLRFEGRGNYLLSN